MSVTFDQTLSTDRDWVRTMIGDRNVDRAVLSDEEIDAILLEEKNKYLAAARCGDLIIAQGRGAVSKSVGDLSISYGDSPESGYRQHIEKLRKRGCELLLDGSGSRTFRVL